MCYTTRANPFLQNSLFSEGKKRTELVWISFFSFSFFFLYRSLFILYSFHILRIYKLKKKGRGGGGPYVTLFHSLFKTSYSYFYTLSRPALNGAPIPTSVFHVCVKTPRAAVAYHPLSPFLPHPPLHFLQLLTHTHSPHKNHRSINITVLWRMA